jgi:D-alanyl-lipoteichoic acid acyltransferase DltB (MBOAT superfamily)
VILGFELTLFLYATLSSLFWILRIFSVRVALGALLAANVLLLSVANTLMLVYLVAQMCLVGVLYLLVKRFPRRGDVIPWFSFIGVIPVNLQLWSGQSWGAEIPTGIFTDLKVGNTFWALGATFFVVKSFVVLKEGLAAKEFELLPALVGLTFLPSFSAGPIHGGAVWSPSRLAISLTPKVVINALLMLGWGAASFYVIAPWFRAHSQALEGVLWGGLGQLYLDFAALFFDFSGYTLMAISCGAVFGASLPHNFNRPYLATSIREFWQRWHMSLSWFVGTYLFKPFVRKTGSQRKAIFLAFVCVGLWHEVTLGYLLWGVGHGAALSVAMRPPAVWERVKRCIPSPAVTLSCWFLTMTWVATLSYLANKFFK